MQQGNNKKKIKYNIHETTVENALIYGAKTWRITKKDKKKVEAVEMDAVRFLYISRRERVKSHEQGNPPTSKTIGKSTETKKSV